MNIVEEIKLRAHGSRVAIQDGDLAISFDALFDAVREVRLQLLKSSVFSGPEAPVVPRVGVRFPNGLGYIVVALAVLDAGACFVPIPDELTEAEREKLIQTTALHGVLSWRDEAGEGEGEGEGEGAFELPLELGGARLEEREVDEVLFPEEEFDALNPAFIRFSSGTTADSKGVVLSHESLFDRICAANSGLMIEPGERVLWTLPMAHHFAVSIVLYLYAGATTILENTHQPDAIYRAARASGANLLYGSPFHFAQLAQCAEAAPLPELRLAVSTASALSDGVAEAFLTRFNLPLTQALGIIEVGLPVLNRDWARKIPLALGRVLDAYEWKIAGQLAGGAGDCDTLDVDGVNNVGELLLRGPGMFDAYLVPWKTREEVAVDGWFATGDLVSVVETLEAEVEEVLMMQGRCKSVINVGGMKVFPEEVESVILEIGGIISCRVFAEEHPTLGAYPVGEFVVDGGEKSPTALEIRKYCQLKLAPYKIPMRMLKVGHIELTASGKVKRW